MHSARSYALLLCFFCVQLFYFWDELWVEFVLFCSVLCYFVPFQKTKLGFKPCLAIDCAVPCHAIPLIARAHLPFILDFQYINQIVCAYVRTVFLSLSLSLSLHFVSWQKEMRTHTHTRTPNGIIFSTWFSCWDKWL